MNWINKLERKFGRYAIRNLMFYIMILYGVGFVLINPFLLCPDYTPVLSPEELACLEVQDSGELSYYSICVVRSNYLENTVNLKCPLVINPQTRHGIQVILENSPYEYRHELRSFPTVVGSTDGSEEDADPSAQKK